MVKPRAIPLARVYKHDAGMKIALVLLIDYYIYMTAFTDREIS